MLQNRTDDKLPTNMEKEVATTIGHLYYTQHFDAGWSSLVARRAHNPKVVGSNPAPATK